MVSKFKTSGVAALWLLWVAGSAAPVYAQSAPQGKQALIQWESLAQASPAVKNGAINIVYPAALQPYDGKLVTITGFMVPLEAKKEQTRFLLTQKPQDCEFCIEGGPTSYIDVHSVPLRFSLKPMKIVGRLKLLQNDPSGMFYRLSEAKLDSF